MGGFWDWVKDAATTVTKFVKPIYKPVTTLARQYIPGAGAAIDAGEAIYDSFVGDTSKDAQKLTESAQKTYDEGRGAVTRTIERGKDSIKKLKDVGGEFVKTVKNPKEWINKITGAGPKAGIQDVDFKSLPVVRSGIQDVDFKSLPAVVSSKPKRKRKN